MVRSWHGERLLDGVAAFTEDERLWDGARLHRRESVPRQQREGRLLRSAEIVVEALMDCCPGSVVRGGVALLGDTAVRRLRRAAFVRFRDPDGHVEIWRAEDGTELLLLVGAVARPPLGGGSRYTSAISP